MSSIENAVQLDREARVLFLAGPRSLYINLQVPSSSSRAFTRYLYVRI